MDILLISLVAISLVCSIVAAIGSWKNSGSSTSEESIKSSIALSEEAILSDNQTHREDLERHLSKHINEASQSIILTLGKSSNETQEKLYERFGEFRESQNKRFETLQEQLRVANKDSREEQTKQLDSIRLAFEKLNENNIKSSQAQLESSSENFSNLSNKLTTTLQDFSERIDKANKESRLELTTALEKLQDAEEKSQLAQTKSFIELQEKLQLGLDNMRKDNEAKLEKIRVTVEEKLQSTLQERLGESFKIVSDRLEQVHKGLGEMQTLATGVGDLKRVLTNVRTRGTYGEVQLRALIEQVLAPTQYEENVATIPGSSERVEFAIILPGRESKEDVVRLPIDAKFPQEDYLRLVDAYERADHDEAENCRKALGVRLLGEAKKIHEKYVSPPSTTDFAILFVPTEGLFAEALRINGLTEKMQHDYHVTFAGPTTLLALLNSLQMGFQTLKIQKHSSEVWKILGAVKTEFTKFGDSLEAVRKNLQTAQNKIDSSFTRSRAMMRALKTVEELGQGEAKELLPDLEDSD